MNEKLVKVSKAIFYGESIYHEKKNRAVYHSCDLKSHDFSSLKNNTKNMEHSSFKVKVAHAKFLHTIFLKYSFCCNYIL